MDDNLADLQTRHCRHQNGNHILLRVRITEACNRTLQLKEGYLKAKQVHESTNIRSAIPEDSI
jgi:hypothetical protein